MSLVTYAEVRPWAKAIRDATKLRKMPPWFADPRYGAFENDPRLSSAELQLIEAWVRDGAPEGSPGDAPVVARRRAGWSIPQPDIVLSMPKPFAVPARADIEYQYFVFPDRFDANRWVRAVEIRPGDRSVVHHAVLYVREGGDEWLRNAPRGVMFEAPKGNTAAHKRISFTTSDILAIYTPGCAASEWPAGMAKKIPAGSELVLQLHYTSKRVAARDQTRIGITYAASPPVKRVLTLQMGRDDIDIPAGDRHYRLSVSGSMPQDALLLAFLPHMHLRGSSFEYSIVGENGYDETLLLVNPYDFFWQLAYTLKDPRLLKAGTRLRFTGEFDNSPNNPRNPDPSAEVHWGEQSHDEMMIGFFDVAVHPSVDKKKLFVRSR
jgi:hypothetical protein